MYNNLKKAFDTFGSIYTGQPVIRKDYQKNSFYLPGTEGIISSISFENNRLYIRWKNDIEDTIYFISTRHLYIDFL